MLIESTKPNWRERLTQRWRTARYGVRPTEISFDEDGVKITRFWENGASQTTQLEWSEVNGVIAYKRDLISVDLICIGLTTSDGTLEIHEEMAGWTALTSALPRYLAGTRSTAEWWDEVAHPAFAANPTVLFTRR